MLRGTVTAYLQSRGLGKRVAVSTVDRWMIAGVQGVRLESVRIGGQMVTSAEAIQRWVEAREEAKNEGLTLAPSSSATKQVQDSRSSSMTMSSPGVGESGRAREDLPRSSD